MRLILDSARSAVVLDTVTNSAEPAKNTSHLSMRRRKLLDLLNINTVPFCFIWSFLRFVGLPQNYLMRKYLNLFYNNNVFNIYFYTITNHFAVQHTHTHTHHICICKNFPMVDRLCEQIRCKFFNDFLRLHILCLPKY